MRESNGSHNATDHTDQDGEDTTRRYTNFGRTVEAAKNLNSTQRNEMRSVPVTHTNPTTYQELQLENEQLRTNAHRMAGLLYRSRFGVGIDSHAGFIQEVDEVLRAQGIEVVD